MQETWVRSLGQEDPWRRAWQCTPISLPGESYGQRNLVGYSTWDCTESDMTKRLTHKHCQRKRDRSVSSLGYCHVPNSSSKSWLYFYDMFSKPSNKPHIYVMLLSSHQKKKTKIHTSCPK